MVLKFGVELRRWDIWFDPYQEKSASSRLQDNRLGLGGNVVCHFADVLSGCGGNFFHLCYNNFFNSVKLVTTLKYKLVKATGTIRENKTEKCPLISNNALKKHGRGKFDFKTDTKNDILVCKWNDNSVVNLYSNAAGVHPLSKASRFLLKRSGCKLTYLFYSSSTMNIWGVSIEWIKMFENIELL